MTAVQTLPVSAVVVCACALAWHEHGSIDAQSWLPYSIAIALVAAIVLAVGVAARPSRAATIGICALALLAGWAALSLLWAPSPSLARDEGLLTATYALAVAVAVVSLWTDARRLAALAAVVAGSGGLAVAAAAELVWGASPADRYFGGRLAFPITYINATGALFAVGFWPGIVLAARRSASVAMRAFALGGATACLAGVVLTQSKGAVTGLAVTTAVVLVTSPLRLRLVPPLAGATVLAALGFGRLTAPFRSSTDAVVRHAAATLLLLTLVAVLAALPYALVDANLRVGAETQRRWGRALLALLVTAVLAAGAGFVARVHHPGAWVGEKWRSAHHAAANENDRSSHLFELGSNRFDFWRVALGEFERHPLAGDGARGFGPAYLVHGHSAETPRRAHSLPLEVLSEQGIVGFALLATAFVALLAVAFSRVRRADVVAVAAVGGVLTWLVQACVDWTWTLPADSLPALLLLGIGGAASDGFGAVPMRVGRPVAALAVAVAVLAFAPPWLAARYTQRALATHSQGDLSTARRLDPLSTAPLLAEVWVEPLQETLPALRSAAAREPRVAGTRYVLGMAYLELGRRAEARRELRAALALKPGDPLIRNALERAA